jgi:hypothetical protein
MLQLSQKCYKGDKMVEKYIKVFCSEDEKNCYYCNLYDKKLACCGILGKITKVIKNKKHELKMYVVEQITHKI